MTDGPGHPPRRPGPEDMGRKSWNGSLVACNTFHERHARSGGVKYSTHCTSGPADSRKGTARIEPDPVKMGPNRPRPPTFGSRGLERLDPCRQA